VSTQVVLSPHKCLCKCLMILEEPKVYSPRSAMCGMGPSTGTPRRHLRDTIQNRRGGHSYFWRSVYEPRLQSPSSPLRRSNEKSDGCLQHGSKVYHRRSVVSPAMAGSATVIDAPKAAMPSRGCAWAYAVVVKSVASLEFLEVSQKLEEQLPFLLRRRVEKRSRRQS